MELIRGVHNLYPRHRGCVATIGNFDGVHLGHQAVLKQTSEKARELELPATVITFEPQPQEFFRPEQAPPRLTRLREKMLALKPHAIDRLLCLDFNRYLANLTAQEFIDKIIVDGLQVRYLVVGDDFRFGKGRQGDFEMLVQAGKQYGFEVANTHSFTLGNERVSSTLIRQALWQGDLQHVKRLLGRPYSMCGRVAHGDKRGRTIGFPTANIYLHRQNTPILGVYAVQMNDVEQYPVNGVANIGTRPTVCGTRTLLEVHLFDFDKDIYGAHIEVSFVQKIRDEKRFESFDALKQQIHLDAQQARTILTGS
ncbi:MAG: bifunctional riboflavin kinase/FAD synthetase [Gammaproteobacteria bacterium]|nr:bifunctional riboflavin kinase/FAD synthetase [Gammaproteobacteria bacterium]